MYRGKRVGVVVPAYNEELHIGAVLAGMPDYVDGVYVIDDCSTDRTREIAGQWVFPDSRVQLMSHARNQGVGAAIVSGYRRCLADGIDIAVVMAGDNQMDPQLLPALMDPVVEGRAGYCKGTRMAVRGHHQGMTCWRLIGNSLLRWLTAVAIGNTRITDPQNGYTAVSRQALEKLDLGAVYPGYGYCNDLLTRLAILNVRPVEIPSPLIVNPGQTSSICYGSYIRSVSILLLCCLLLRVRASMLRLVTADSHFYGAEP